MNELKRLIAAEIFGRMETERQTNADFLPPGDIPQRVRDFCRRTGQLAP